MPQKKKRALIIGISGQDGVYLAKFLLQKGYETWGTSRDAQMSSFTNLFRLGIRDNVQVELMSITDFRSVIQVLRKITPDEIYNLVGQTSVNLSFKQSAETFESITLSTLNLLEALRFSQMKARLFNASSSESFGNTNGEAATEKAPFRPRPPYAIAKAAASWQTANYKEAYGIFTCSGILFNYESPLRPARFVTRKIIIGACRIVQGLQEELSLGNIDIQMDWGGGAGLCGRHVENPATGEFRRLYHFHGENPQPERFSSPGVFTLRPRLGKIRPFQFGLLSVDGHPYFTKQPGQGKREAGMRSRLRDYRYCKVDDQGGAARGKSPENYFLYGVAGCEIEKQAIGLKNISGNLL